MTASAGAAPAQAQERVFDCLVVSGGGGKGAFGAGVALALDRAYTARSKGSPPVPRPEMCYIGASAGALDASVLACQDAEALVRVWLAVTPQGVLGTRWTNPYVRVTVRWFSRLLRRRPPAALFGNAALRRLIAGEVSLAKLSGRHLVIAVTNRDGGELGAFYASDLFDDFVKHDEAQPVADRRLRHLIRLTDDAQLVDALLASGALPIAFPPVRVGVDWYIDGGVGNNTPTREAAYFMRFLIQLERGHVRDVYCVKHDPPRVRASAGPPVTMKDAVLRMADVYQYNHMAPIVDAWHRINREVTRQHARIDGVIEWLRTHAGIAPAQFPAVEMAVRQQLGFLGGVTERRRVPLIEIEPAEDLGETIDFRPDRIRKSLKHGYLQALAVLKDKERLDSVQHRELVNARAPWDEVA